MGIVWQATYFAILLYVGVLIHELGHVIAGRALGLRVSRVSLGVGPTLLAGSWRLAQVSWALLIPLPIAKTSLATVGEAFYRIERWKRVVFSLAGSSPAIIMALLLLAVPSIGRSAAHGLLTVSSFPGVVGLYTAVTVPMTEGLPGLFAAFALANLSMGLFNLVPLVRFDGGNALFFLLERREGILVWYILLSRVMRMALAAFFLFVSVKEVNHLLL